MNTMVSQFLHRPAELRRKLNHVNMEIAALELSMLPGAIRYDTDNIQSSPDDKMILFAIQMDVLAQKQERLIKDYNRARHDVLSALRQLPEKERRVIYYKYMVGLSNAQIAEELSISPRWVMKLCDKAYDCIQNLVLSSPLKYAIL